MSIFIGLIDRKGEKRIIQVNINDKIGKVKEELGVKSAIWKCNGEILKDDRCFSDYEIDEYDAIIANPVMHQGGGGCFGVETIDVSKNKTKNIGFSNTGKLYRLVNYGLSIQSKCKNEICIAYQDTIYVNIGFVTNWNLLDNLKKIICPACQKRVVPLNFGFFNCKYEIEYEKIEEDDYKDGKINGFSGKEEYIIFDEYSSGKSTFTKMIFNITKNN